MRALVFGRTGQVARELQRRAPPEWRLACVGREIADFRDPSACGAVVVACEADVIINAAAYTAVDRAESEEDLATVVNAAAPAAIAAAAASRRLPLIHLSSDYVFDGSGNGPRRPDDAPCPGTAYGRSKLAGERAILAAGGSPIILRTSWVFAAHGANFVNTMLRLGGERAEVAVVADQVGGPTSAASIAEALIRVARRATEPGAPTGIYHFAGEPDVSWADFAREIFRQAKMPTRVREISTGEYPTPARRPANSRLDCTSLTRDFGIDRPDWWADLQQVLEELEAYGAA